MAARNPITNDEIKSRSYSKTGRDNHDRIFAKKTAQGWLDYFNCSIKIIDPDGWRQQDGITLDTPIKFNDFLYRLQLSTCYNNFEDWEKIENFGK